MRGAVTVFVVLRVLVIAQLALWVYAFVARTPANAPPNFVYAVTWEAYAAVAAAFVALAATLAVIGKRSSDV